MIKAEIGKIYRHVKTRDKYQVVGFCLASWDIQQALVIYSNIDTKECWARSMTEFEDGRFQEVEYESAQTSEDKDE